MTPADKFDQANRNFKIVFRDHRRPHWMKYRYLHNWTLQKSKYLLNDEHAYLGSKKVYRRGAIVNVDFGVNVGTELSGNHFAIILNKNDGPSNDKLTVIPLTSHYHPHTVELKQTLRRSANQIFAKQMFSFIEIYAAVAILRNEAMASLQQQLMPSGREFIEKVASQMNNASVQKLFEEYANGLEKRLTDSESARVLISHSNVEMSGLEDPLSLKFLENLASAIQASVDATNMYMKYDLTTYAKVLDITTISKSRLRKLNEYDPIGDIMVDNETLNTIDSEIKQLFTK